MKTNIFRVREKKEKRIIIEEERTKNPLLLFFKRYGGCFSLVLFTLLIVSLLVSLGVAFSLFRGSNDYDISYVNGSEEINSNNNPDIDDSDVSEKLLGEIARAEGVVVLVETFMSGQGDVVSYYTDGTAVIVRSDGTIYRVSPLSNGNYGVDRNGKIDDKVKKILVMSNTVTLGDGTVITYYSDGTAKVELKSETIFVRDSNNIRIDGGNNFTYVNPSGVALSKNVTKVTDRLVVNFTDGTTLISQNGKKIIVNKNTGVSVDGDNVSYDVHNIFQVIGERTLKDGNVITHYGNGAATITDKDGNVIYVKKAGDIVIKNDKLYEIITNEYGFSRNTVKCPDGKTVIYYDNGGAVIIYPDGRREYVADNTEIIYDSSGNISSSPSVANLISEKKTVSGDQVFNFDNGKSQVIKSDGSSYIVDTNKLTFASNGDIIDEPIDVDKNKNNSSKENEDPGANIYVSEAENKYNDLKNIEDTTFIIRNNNDKSRVLRITIEEVANYKKFNTKRLEPRYVRFQASVGDEFVTARALTNKVWRNSDNVINYVIYDGRIPAKSTVNVSLSLYVDYAELSNLYQDTGFIGTIKIYVNG